MQRGKKGETECICIRTRRSNITLCLKEFPRAKTEGISEGGGVYLTKYPDLSSNLLVSLSLMIIVCYE